MDPILRLIPPPTINTTLTERGNHLLTRGNEILAWINNGPRTSWVHFSWTPDKYPSLRIEHFHYEPEQLERTVQYLTEHEGWEVRVFKPQSIAKEKTDG